MSVTMISAALTASFKINVLIKVSGEVVLLAAFLMTSHILEDIEYSLGIAMATLMPNLTASMAIS